MSNSLTEFMKIHFNNLTLRPPLFYSWSVGIRFEISKPGIQHEDQGNLKQIEERIMGIFSKVFHDSDEVFLITDIHCKSNNTFLHKRPTKIYQKYIKDKALTLKLQHSVLPNVFTEHEEEMVTHQFTLSCKTSDIRYKQLLTAISYEDFPHPSQLLKRQNRAGIDVYFVNITKKIIFHFYDDRGCDVIASNKEALHDLYKERNDWILDYDRDKIDKLFH